MNIPQQIAKHVREVYFGGNWTTSNLKQHLSDVTWQQATLKIHSFNTIATLAYHIYYYINVQLIVLKGNSLEAHDKFSFSHPPINAQNDWDSFLEKVWKDADEYATLIEKLPETILSEPFTDNKYGNYYRNLAGVIEHTHYHLGQIVLIKKLILEEENN